MAEKSDSGNASQETAFAEDEIGMEMADNSLIELGESRTNGLLVPEIRERGGVVAKEKDALIGFEGVEDLADSGEVSRSEFMPLPAF